MQNRRVARFLVKGNQGQWTTFLQEIGGVVVGEPLKAPQSIEYGVQVGDEFVHFTRVRPGVPNVAALEKVCDDVIDLSTGVTKKAFTDRLQAVYAAMSKRQADIEGNYRGTLFEQSSDNVDSADSSDELDDPRAKPGPSDGSINS